MQLEVGFFLNFSFYILFFRSKSPDSSFHSKRITQNKHQEVVIIGCHPRFAFERLWSIKLRFKVNHENKYRLLGEQLLRKDIPMCFGGFVSLHNNKRIISFDECLVCLNSFYNKKILIMIIPILEMINYGMESKSVQLQIYVFSAPPGCLPHFSN